MVQQLQEQLILQFKEIQITMEIQISLIQMMMEMDILIQKKQLEEQIQRIQHLSQRLQSHQSLIKQL